MFKEPRTTKKSPFPEVEHIDDIYTLTLDENIPRYTRISKRFSDLFSTKFTHITRIPSTIAIPSGMDLFPNLPTLLLCLEKDTLTSISTRDHDQDIVICTLDQIKFPKIQLSPDDPLKYRVSSEKETSIQIKHYNIVIAACKAFFNEHNLVGKRKACNILIDVDSPYNEGLGNSLGVMVGVY
jgi:hypothetical protein